MDTMKAIIAHSDGQLKIQNVPRPNPGPTEVLIKAHAVGVNPVDNKTRLGSGVNGFFDDAEPMILGWDVAGEVVEVGIGVTRFRRGDRVFGMPRFPRPANAYAEYVVAGSREIAGIPDSVSYETAAAAPLAGLTAWQSVVDTFQIGSGDRILIHAASGGVGHIAVQIAKKRGATVWGTASKTNHETLRKLGVDHVIDYKTERFEEIATEMDVVLDLVGLGDNPARSVKSLRNGGRLLVIPSPANVPDPEILKGREVTAGWLLVEPDYASLERIAEMMDAGELEVIVGETRPLEQVAELHAMIETGGPFGKLVATVS